jgi:polyvinyl alcohol dehydrogenase (cytochrome)
MGGARSLRWPHSLADSRSLLDDRPARRTDLAALTIANGVLYAGSMSHEGEQMYAVNAARGSILWRFAAGGSVVAGTAVVNGVVCWGSGFARTGGVGNDLFYAVSIGGR